MALALWSTRVDHLENIATALANDNHVEEAWCLRGLIDKITRAPAEVPGEYRLEYLAGFQAGQVPEGALRDALAYPRHKILEAASSLLDPLGILLD